MREIKVRDYLCQQVERRGGMFELFTSPGTRNVPDCQISDRPGRIDYVETKAPKKKPRIGQLRDHARRRQRGFRVFVLDTHAKVDEYMERYYGAP
jgi:hypothetical protein